jgi:hypothetical protein
LPEGLAAAAIDEQHVGVTSEWELEPLSDDDTTAESPSTGRSARRWIIGVVAVAAGGAGFVAGAATARDRPARYDCGERVVAVIAAEKLPDEPVEVLVPLRSGDLGRAPLPLLTSMATELVGSPVEHQQFRPAAGRLVLGTELPRDAIGRIAQIVGSAGPPVLADVPIAAPLCKARSTAQ